MGVLEPIPAALGREAGYALDKSRTHPWTNVQRRSLNPDIQFCCSFSITISLLTQIHVCQLWEKGGGPGENPSRGKENVRTPYRKRGSDPMTFLLRGAHHAILGCVNYIICCFSSNNFIKSPWLLLYCILSPWMMPH